MTKGKAKADESRNTDPKILQLVQTPGETVGRIAPDPAVNAGA